MTAIHRLSPDQFALFASGGGSRPAIEALRRAQLSKHKVLIKFIVERWPRPVAGRDLALAVLDEAQARGPAAVDDLLGDPLVGIWAASGNELPKNASSSAALSEVRVVRTAGGAGALASAATAASSCGSRPAR